MALISFKRRSSRMLAAAALLMAGTAVSTVSAVAGECPEGKTMADGRMPGPSNSSDVTDTVIGAINLAEEPVSVPDHMFRLRKLVVKPGGVVAWHSHADRPAIIYILSGSIVEYRNTCSEPIVHKAGEVSRETHETQHWWKNISNEPVELLSTDILHNPKDQHTM